ncbi:hypothetical protein ABVK25_012563, partial [Lepraria finkii]
MARGIVVSCVSEKTRQSNEGPGFDPRDRSFYGGPSGRRATGAAGCRAVAGWPQRGSSSRDAMATVGRWPGGRYAPVAREAPWAHWAGLLAPAARRS